MPELRIAGVRLTLDDETLDALAELVADRVAGAGDEGPEPWIDVEEAAAHLACPRSRIYALVSARRIPHERDGSRLLFRRSVLDAWVEAGGAKRP